MITYNDVEYKENLFLDLYLPQTKNYDLFIYFHGGGLNSGTRKSAEVFASTLEKGNIATVSVDYSLYPDAKFPDFIVDCADSIAWIIKNFSKYGEYNRIFVGGSSAGGYISMMLCFDDRYLINAGVNPNKIAGYVHDAGQPTTHFHVLEEFGYDKNRVIIDEKAPLYFVGTKENYPPMLFIISDNDKFIGRYEQTMLTIKALENFGHKDNVFLEVPHGKHCEHTKKIDENSESVFGKIILSFIDKISSNI